MRILHTSDWHLGRTLYGQNRYQEHAAFLDWLATTMEREAIEVLLVAGDVFDTGTPSNRAQELYYHFLCRVAASPCRHVVLIAGNHDSPSFLNAPKALLKALDVHVLGNAAQALEDEILVLRDAAGIPELIVCAVPYLRDRDLRVAEAGETAADKERKLLEGIRSHYAAVAALAEAERRQLGATLPVVAMGHLFAAGGQTVEDDGVRELYIGSLVQIGAGIFAETFDYVALGHLHVPQQVGGQSRIRYSGSPLAMGFGEARQEKSLCRVTFAGRSATVQLLPVPVFQQLARIRGDWEGIVRQVGQLTATPTPVWLEVIYDGAERIGDLRERLETILSGTGALLLRVKNTLVVDQVLAQLHDQETLDDLDAGEVFERCLERYGVAEAQRPALRRTYQETLASLDQDDIMAE